MSKELINRTVSVEIPDGFHTMTSEELRHVFLNDDPKRWGTWDKERHVMITVLWKDYPLLLSRMTDLKAVCRKNEQLNSSGYADHGYQCERFFSLTVDHLPAEGYAFSYKIGDIRQSAETILVKLNRTIYSITCAGRTENKAADHESFVRITDGIRFL